MRGDQVHTVVAEGGIEAIAVIRPISDEMLGLGLEHVEVETELHQGDFMMIRRMRAHGKGQSVPIHKCQDFHTLAAFREPDGLAAALGRRKCGIDETFAFIQGSFVTQRIRQLGEDLSQDLPLAPLLEPAMHRLVVGIALREQVPLRPGVQNPEHRVQDGPGGDRFAAGASVRDVFFRKLVPNSLPLIVAQLQHGARIRTSVHPVNDFEIGSRLSFAQTTILHKTLERTTPRLNSRQNP